MPVCDVCTKSMNFSDGYALTTVEVACNKNYWSYLLSSIISDDELLMMTVQQQAKQISGWLVCKSCSSMFSFDRQQAKRYASQQKDPPGAGAADINMVAAAAARAWKEKHGTWPSWVR